MNTSSAARWNYQHVNANTLIGASILFWGHVPYKYAMHTVSPWYTNSELYMCNVHVYENLGNMRLGNMRIWATCEILYILHTDSEVWYWLKL